MCPVAPRAETAGRTESYIGTWLKRQRDQLIVATKIAGPGCGFASVTVNGRQLSDISGPKRMVEILIPKQLLKTNILPTSKEIVLDATTAPKQPFRCTVFCASAAKTEEVLKSDILLDRPKTLTKQ